MQKQRVKTSMSVPEMGKMLGLGVAVRAKCNFRPSKM